MNLEQAKTTLHDQMDSTDERDVSLPLYISAAIVQLAALVAVGYQIDSTNFTYFTIIMTVLGFATSYSVRRFGVSSESVKIGAVVLALLFLYGLRSIGIVGIGTFQQTGGQQEMILVSILALTATFCSFLYHTDDAVIFPCVWAIALIGLTGTVNINIELIVSFVVFFCAAIFLLVHQSHLARQRKVLGENPTISENDERRKLWLPLLRTQAMVAIACAVVSLLLGFVIAIPLQIIGRGLSINQFLQRLRLNPSAASLRGITKARLEFNNGQEFQVGLGPIDNDNRLALTVKSPRPLYWRGRVFSVYNGQGWLSDLSQTSEPVPPTGSADDKGMSTFDVPQGENAATRKKTQRLQFEFHVENSSLQPLYHAVEPIRVRAPINDLLVRPSNTISAPRGSAGNDYIVESNVSFATENELRRSGTNYPPLISALYSRGENNQIVREFTQQAVASVPNNPFDRAEAIRQFVADRCTYTLEARPVPPRRDAAEFFLNESREGYCDLYATATTLMCRSAGIPARIATGFVPGTPSDTEPGKYILTGNDRHAWTEIYFVGYGWFPLDATTTTSGVTPVPRAQPVAAQRAWWQKIGFWPLVIGGIGGLFLLYAVFNEFASRTALKQKSDLLSPSAIQVARIYQQTARRVGKRSGLQRTKSTTPREYLRTIREKYDSNVAESLESLTNTLEQALYSPQTADAAQVQTARNQSGSVSTALRNVKKT